MASGFESNRRFFAGREPGRVGVIHPPQRRLENTFRLSTLTPLHPAVFRGVFQFYYCLPSPWGSGGASGLTFAGNRSSLTDFGLDPGGSLVFIFNVRLQVQLGAKGSWCQRCVPRIRFSTFSKLGAIVGLKGVASRRPKGPEDEVARLACFQSFQS